MCKKQKIEIELDLEKKLEIKSFLGSKDGEKDSVFKSNNSDFFKSDMKTIGETTPTDSKSSKENPSDVMFKISYIIHIERKELPKDIIELLKKNNVKFETWKIRTLKKEYDNSPDELSCVSLNPEIYIKLKKLAIITGIPMEDIASKELGDFFNSVGDIPVIFLDRHLGIENIENPLEMLEQMNTIINIGDKFLTFLKTQDLTEHVKKWFSLEET